MKHAHLLAGLPLLLAGCAMATTPATHPPKSVTQVEHSATLTGHHWLLHTATDRNGQRIPAFFASKNKPLQLDFKQGHLRVSHGCNAMGSDYHVAHGKLKVDAIISTMMACSDPALNKLDRAIKARLRQPLAFKVSRHDGRPILTLTTADGDTLVFIGKPDTSP